MWVTRAAEAAAAIFFGSWWLLSVAHQFNQFTKIKPTAWIRNRDPIGFLPSWTFFAPRPGKTDYHLVYRQVSPASPLSGWIEIPMVSRRHWSHMLWNPARRRTKVMSDCINSVSRQMHDERENGDEPELTRRRLVISVPYLMILTHVMSVDRETLVPASYRQFALVEWRGGRSASAVSVAMCSTLHPCDAEQLSDVASAS